jgi:flagellar basal-body rod protein FlgC
MSNLPIFDVAGSAMNAQSVRLSTVASNLANADSISGDPSTVFRARQPVFLPSNATSRATRSPTRRATCTRPTSIRSRRWST